MKTPVVKKLYGNPVAGGTLFVSEMPPSLNNAFINVRRGGRIKSPQYATWLQLARLQLKCNGPWHVPGKVRVNLRFNRAGTRADLDNLQKPVLDLLVASGRMEDDRNVVEITSRFMDLGKNAVRIRIEAIGSTREDLEELAEVARLKTAIRQMAAQTDLQWMQKLAADALATQSVHGVDVVLS